MNTYDPSKIEPKWQAYWDAHDTFKTPAKPEGPTYYVLDMFPYPSGSGLHVGHPEGYTATDIIARAKRAQGYSVLHPMGWDAFGLPAEQYAIKTGTHPEKTTRENVAKFKSQLKMLGFSYDWTREVNTTDPEYYRWTQWIFLKLYERGLAYQAEVPVNWCPALGTVLANEEVVDGVSEVGGHPVIRRPMRQWMLRITEYAEQLLDGLDDLDWPESTKAMQRNWIGKSVGAEIDFAIQSTDSDNSSNSHSHITVFTTRPDTLFGATYMVLAPEHPAVNTLLTQDQEAEARAYIEQAANKSDLERQELSKVKTGVFTGAFAINPVTDQPIPIWIADYVLGHYGTGAIMAVPGQDERDYEFAKAFDLPILRTVQPPSDFEGGAYTGDGPAVESGFLNGMHISEAKEAMMDWLEKHKTGRRKTQYKLRDWLFSRQRYWGEPFPIVHVDGKAEPLSPDDLPVILPEVEDYKPSEKGEPPLAKATDWVKTTFQGQEAIRETNTMPQWAGSCWYYLRYMSPNYTKGPLDPEAESIWKQVDLYIGGAEHSVLHLLYARFWHKVLFDAGVVSTSEPFKKLVHQGMILGELEFTAFRYNAEWISKKRRDEILENEPEASIEAVRCDEEDVEKRGDAFVHKTSGVVVEAKAHKMSKSRGNVINPDDVVDRYGADSLRLYEMFMGPLEQVKPWSTKGVEGVYRFLGRVWRLMIDDQTGQLQSTLNTEEPSKAQNRLLHQTIQKVTDDIEGLRMNTAISALMIFVNEANGWESLPRTVAEQFVCLLHPFAPHIAEELWERLGHQESISHTSWPVYDEALLVEDEVTLAVQVNGKVRGTIEVATAQLEDQEAVLTLAKNESNVKKYLDAGALVKEIYVPGRVLNFVVK